MTIMWFNVIYFLFIDTISSILPFQLFFYFLIHYIWSWLIFNGTFHQWNWGLLVWNRRKKSFTEITIMQSSYWFYLLFVVYIYLLIYNLLNPSESVNNLFDFSVIIWIRKWFLHLPFFRKKPKCKTSIW